MGSQVSRKKKAKINPMNVLIDPDSQEADGSDMKFAFVTSEMPMDDFEATYPDAKPDDWESNDNYSEWFGESVRVAEHWYVEERDRKLHMLEDGTVVTDEQIEQEYRKNDGPGRSQAENQSAMQHRNRIEHFPGNGAAGQGQYQRHGQNPVARHA